MRHFDAGSKRAVSQLQFHPSAARVTASIRSTNHLVTWDIASGNAERTSSLAGGGVTCFAYSPDGEVLAVGGTDGVARPYLLPEMRSVAELFVGVTTHDTTRQPVHAIAYSPDLEPGRQWLAAGGAELWLWNRATHEYICAPEDGGYHGVCFGPDGTTILAIHAVAALVGWTFKPLREQFRLPIARAAFVQFALSPDAETVALRTLMTIDLRTLDNRHLHRLSFPSFHAPADMAFTPDGRLLLVASGSFPVFAFDTATGQLAREYDWGIGKVTAVAVSPDGTMAAAGGEKGKVVVWDLDS